MRTTIVCMLSAAAMLSGCEGPMGPPGLGTGSLSDPSVMPRVIYSYPPANSVGPYPELYYYDCIRGACTEYSQFQLRFNKFMDISSVRRAVRLLSPDGNLRADTNFILSVGGDVFIVNPVDSQGYRSSLRFPIGGSYTLGVDTGALDVNGNRLSQPFSATFVPEPFFRCVEIFPPNGATDVGVGMYIQIRFNSSVDASLFSHMTIEPPVFGRREIGSDSAWALIIPWNQLNPATLYTVRLDGSASDAEGNMPAGPFSSSFTTIGFRMYKAAPDPGASDVPLASEIRVSFTLGLDTSTVRGAFHLSPATDGDFSGLYQGSNTIRFSPDGGLLSSTVYTVRIDTTLRSAGGFSLREPLEYTFTTGPFSVLYTYPVNGQISWPRDYWIGVGTNALLDAASIAPSIMISPPADLSFSSCDRCSWFEFHATGGLAPMTEYTVTIGTALKTARGEPLVTPCAITFTTGPD